MGPGEEGQGQGSSGVLPLRVVAKPRDLSTGRRPLRRTARIQGRRSTAGQAEPRWGAWLSSAAPATDKTETLAGEMDLQGCSPHQADRQLPHALPGTQKGQAGQERLLKSGGGGRGGHGLVPESQADREKIVLKPNTGVDDDGEAGQSQASRGENGSRV